MAFLLISNGPGRLPVVDVVKTAAEALERYAEDPACIVVEGRVLTIQQRTVTLIDGQPAEVPPANKEVPDAIRQWQCPADPGAPGAAEHPVDVAGSAPGEPGAAPREGAGERPDAGGDGTASGTGAGQQG